uniref:Uncharacterized protein n=1 Tax=Caenorhabditis japonica TaxID=281687 RepID=A0A8R1E946_CAEJA
MDVETEAPQVPAVGTTPIGTPATSLCALTQAIVRHSIKCLTLFLSGNSTLSGFLLYSVLGFKIFSLSVLFRSKSTTPSPLLHAPSLLEYRKARSVVLSSSSFF